MGSDFSLRVRYWGVTGSLPRPLLPAEVTRKLVEALAELTRQGVLADGEIRRDEGQWLRLLEERLPFYLRSTYGGNTTCIEVETPDAFLVVDAGTGIRELSHELSRRSSTGVGGQGQVCHVLLTHGHLDHTSAAAFFEPFYDPLNSFNIWGPQRAIDSLKTMLDPAAPLEGLYFPLSLELMSGLKQTLAVEAGQEIRFGGTRVRPYALTHPIPCLAYRIEHGGRSVVIATDHEQTKIPDPGLADFAHGADLLYMDAHYLADEYDGRVGIMGGAPRSHHEWGHSTVEACVDTAAAARARRLHLGHREPMRDDRDLFRIEQIGQKRMRELLASSGRAPDECPVQLAYEGLVVEM